VWRDSDGLAHRGRGACARGGVVAVRTAAEKATNGLAVPAPTSLLRGVWGSKEGTPDYDWLKRRITAHPLRRFTTPISLRNPIGSLKTEQRKLDRGRPRQPAYH
jgi:hypothetical protein